MNKVARGEHSLSFLKKSATISLSALTNCSATVDLDSPSFDAKPLIEIFFGTSYQPFLCACGLSDVVGDGALLGDSFGCLCGCYSLDGDSFPDGAKESDY